MTTAPMADDGIMTIAAHAMTDMGVDTIPARLGSASLRQTINYSALVPQAQEALGRDLSVAEIRRIVDAGPMKGVSLDDIDVQEWLATLDIEYIAPGQHESVWTAFVAGRIDATLSVPEFLPQHIIQDIHAMVDEEAPEALEDGGWMWTVADSDDACAYSVDQVITDEMDMGFDPLSADGIHGFVFRTGATDVALARIGGIAEGNVEAMSILRLHSPREVALDPSLSQIALALHGNA